MKRIIISITSAIAVIFSIVILIYASIFYKGLQNAPELLARIETETPPFIHYVVQSELIARWEFYCTIIIAMSCVAIVGAIITLCFVNIKKQSTCTKAQREEKKKAEKISKLEKELEALKKDGD